MLIAKIALRTRVLSDHFRQETSTVPFFAPPWRPATLLSSLFLPGVAIFFCKPSVHDLLQRLAVLDSSCFPPHFPQPRQFRGSEKRVAHSSSTPFGVAKVLPPPPTPFPPEYYSRSSRLWTFRLLQTLNLDQSDVQNTANSPEKELVRTVRWSKKVSSVVKNYGVSSN